jgi:hypothetical protein
MVLTAGGPRLYYRITAIALGRFAVTCGLTRGNAKPQAAGVWN